MFCQTLPHVTMLHSRLHTLTPPVEVFYRGRLIRITDEASARWAPDNLRYGEQCCTPLARNFDTLLTLRATILHIYIKPTDDYGETYIGGAQHHDITKNENKSGE